MARALRLSALLAVLALVAAACGGTPSGQSSASGSPPPKNLASVEDAIESTTSLAPIDTVVVAARGSIDASPLWIADSEGFFEKNNIRVEFLPVSEEDELFDELTRGRAQAIVVSTATALRRADVYRLDLRLLVYLDGTQGGLEADQGTMSLVAPATTVIDTGCDLIGKKVGVDSVTSLSAVALREMMIRDGCDPTELRLIPSDALTMIEGLSSGDLDAAVLLDPYTTRAVRGQNQVTTNLDNELCPDWGSCPLSVVVSDRSWGRDNPDVETRFRKSIESAILWIRSNELEYRADLVQCCALTADDAGDILMPNFVGDRRDLRSDIQRLASIMVARRELSNDQFVPDLISE